MKVKYVNDNITIKELSENHWNGCKYSTLKFINDAKINEEYEAEKCDNGGYFKVFIDNEEYFVNAKLFGIIEESKRIEPFTKEEMKIYHDMAAPIDDLAHKVSLIIDYINSKEDNNE